MWVALMEGIFSNSYNSTVIEVASQYSYMLIIVCFLAVRSWVKLIREKVGDFSRN